MTRLNDGDLLRLSFISHTLILGYFRSADAAIFVTDSPSGLKYEHLASTSAFPPSIFMAEPSDLQVYGMSLD